MAAFNFSPSFDNTNPYSTLSASPRQDPIRVVFVDFSGAIANPEIHMDPNISYHQFLSMMTEMTAGIIHMLPKLACTKFPGQGLTLGDGNWLYRLVKPFSYNFRRGIFHDRAIDEIDYQHPPMINQTQSDISRGFRHIYRSGVDADEWTILNSATGYQRMIDRMGYGYALQGAWIEIQHQLQKDRDEQSYAAANMIMNMAMSTGNGSQLTNPSSLLQYLELPPMSTSTPLYMYTPDTIASNIDTDIINPGSIWTADETPMIVDGGRAEARPHLQPRTPLRGFPPRLPNSLETSAMNWSSPNASMPMGPAMAPASPPSPSSMPTTIDPALLRTTSRPRVNLPRATTWTRSPDGKLVGRDGSEIVFGSMTAEAAEEDTVEAKPRRGRGRSRGARSNVSRRGRGLARGGTRGPSPLSSDITLELASDA